MIGSHDSKQRGFIIKIMFCIKVSFFCEHETANMKIAFVCGHFTCHLKVIKLHDSFLYSCFVFKCIFQLFIFILQAREESFHPYVYISYNLISCFLIYRMQMIIIFLIMRKRKSMIFLIFYLLSIDFLDHVVCIETLPIL